MLKVQALLGFQESCPCQPAPASLHVDLMAALSFSHLDPPCRSALSTRPKDYALWNKLGATLANSSHSADAIAAYQAALDLKPNYMRAWANMGISQVGLMVCKSKQRPLWAVALVSPIWLASRCRHQCLVRCSSSL